MLIRLLKYEFVKKWISLRYILLGYILLELLLLIISKSFLWNGNMSQIFFDNNSCDGIGASSVLTMLLYFILAIFIMVFAVIENIYRFDRDLSGKQSVLELSIPVISWKKIMAKLVTALCSTGIFIGLGTLAIVMFVLISSHFEKGIVDEILQFIQVLLQSPIRFTLGALYIVFCILSIYMIIFFCTAFSKAITYKNKFAVPIGVASFAVLIAALTFLNDLVMRFPIVRFNLLGDDSLSSLIISVLVFLAALSCTSWLMENKIEH
jgi:hypothetical protein